MDDDHRPDRPQVPEPTSSLQDTSPKADLRVQTCSIFSRDSRETVKWPTNPKPPDRRQPLAQRRRIGDVYYGALSSSQDFDAMSMASRIDASWGAGNRSREEEATANSFYSGSSLLMGTLFAPGALAKVKASVGEILGWRAPGAGHGELWCDPALRSIDASSKLPYLLVTCAASGYVRTAPVSSLSGNSNGGEEAALIVARERSGARQELTWLFLLSPGWCGSERTGFFPTPESLRLSDTLALSSGNDFFTSNRGGSPGAAQTVPSSLCLSRALLWHKMTQSLKLNWQANVHRSSRLPALV